MRAILAQFWCNSAQFLSDTRHRQFRLHQRFGTRYERGRRKCGQRERPPRLGDGGHRRRRDRPAQRRLAAVQPYVDAVGRLRRFALVRRRRDGLEGRPMPSLTPYLTSPTSPATQVRRRDGVEGGQRIRFLLPPGSDRRRLRPPRLRDGRASARLLHRAAVDEDDGADGLRRQRGGRRRRWRRRRRDRPALRSLHRRGQSAGGAAAGSLTVRVNLANESATLRLSNVGDVAAYVLEGADARLAHRVGGLLGTGVKLSGSPLARRRRHAAGAHAGDESRARGQAAADVARVARGPGCGEEGVRILVLKLYRSARQPLRSPAHGTTRVT